MQELVKKDLLSMNTAELEQLVLEMGEKKYRAGQIFSWMHKGVGIDGMTDLSKQCREKLSQIGYVRFPTVEKKLVSKLDGTIKYLFRLYDRQLIESVVMKYKHGNTICISSQVGCRMGCAFCASAIGGLERSLAPSEILGQVIAASRDCGERISNIVMMGIGEPLDNFDNVIKFLELVGAPGGLNIGYRHISLSTCGIADKIPELAKVDLPITLSISLHASCDEVRSEIMPINRKYSLDKLLSACRDYFEKTGRRISFEYALIAGKNDSRETASELAALLRKYFPDRMPLHVNLIPVNEVSERDFKRSGKDAVNDFAGFLQKMGINATVRRKLGADINAACGQLRHSYSAKEK